VIKGRRIVKSENGALQDKINKMEKMVEKINKKLENL
jgi:hypothetical protein